jgi:hypothetical protein
MEEEMARLSNEARGVGEALFLGLLSLVFVLIAWVILLKTPLRLMYSEDEIDHARAESITASFWGNLASCLALMALVKCRRARARVKYFAIAIATLSALISLPFLFCSLMLVPFYRLR